MTLLHHPTPTTPTETPHTTSLPPFTDTLFPCPPGVERRAGATPRAEAPPRAPDGRP
ncbi:hypothetical protein [Streptomyces sp. NPDC091278]|uniref:hypothetical protein n=1 Tax=Streptomyces sp. NPDC091278 TaxID=3155301 RepID=UPI00344CD4A2